MLESIFFKKLNSIGPHQRDVREVYYICLAMGFAGQYCNEGDDYLLEQLKTSNLKVLSGGSMGVPTLDHGRNCFRRPTPVIRNGNLQGSKVIGFRWPPWWAYYRP